MLYGVEQNSTTCSFIVDTFKMAARAWEHGVVSVAWANGFVYIMEDTKMAAWVGFECDVWASLTKLQYCNCRVWVKRVKTSGWGHLGLWSVSGIVVVTGWNVSAHRWTMNIWADATMIALESPLCNKRKIHKDVNPRTVNLKIRRKSCIGQPLDK